MPGPIKQLKQHRQHIYWTNKLLMNHSLPYTYNRAAQTLD